MTQEPGVLMKNPIIIGSWLSTRSSWVLTPDPFPLGPVAWLKCMVSQVGRGHGSRPVQPKRHVRAGMCSAPKQAAQAPRARRGVPITKAEPKHHVYAWSTQLTGWQPKHARLGRPSARWLQPRVRLAGVACLAPVWQPSARCPQYPGRASSLALGSCRLQPPHIPPPTVQSIVKAFTVYCTPALQCRTMQSTVNSLAVINISCYSETVINFSYS
jgi:hypothetical protein